MASIADAGHPARRWSLTALLHRFSAPARPRPVDTPAHTAALEAVTAKELRKKRSYAPPRDAFMENSAMRREMYRL